MPKLEETLIDRLTLRPEVREKARILLRTVHSKTGPGTGYDIGEAKTGLPAICAYLASKALGYADITEEVAQKASCLAPKTFSSTLRTVKTAIHPSKTPNASPSKSGNQVDATAYAALISEHKIGQPLRVEAWMKEAQATLTALPRFRQDLAARHSESSPEVRLAVFFWVCQAIKLSNVQHIPLVDKYNVSLKSFSRLVKTLEDECVELKESIRATIKEMRKKKEKTTNTTSEATSSKSTPVSTPSRSQPQSRSASPTKSALRDASRTPTTTLATGSAKRKVAFSLSEMSASASEDDDGVFAPETPSKRPRTTPRRPFAPSAARTLPVRKTTSRSLSVSSSEDTEDVEMPDAPPLPQPLSTPTSRRLVASEPVAGPSTPRRRSTRVPVTPTHAYRTPPSARTRTQMLSVLSADEEEVDDVAAGAEEDDDSAVAGDDDVDVSDRDDALPLSCRFRPVFLDRAQWAQRAPRLARDRAAAERRTRELIERWGHPFELLGIDATSEAVRV